MAASHLQKPGVEEWLHWAEILVDRLTACVHIYKKPPTTDFFMPDEERQEKSKHTVDLLRRIYILVDQSEMPSDSVPDAHAHDEQTISGLTILFAEALRALPGLSTDMQHLLQSPWLSRFPSRPAEELFFGSRSEASGIGSGYAEHGRLPEILTLLLEREQLGDNRQPREELLRNSEPRRHDVEGRERWNKQNGGFLRTAGRVE
ncbi:MAG: hypothetical protein P4M15_01940 [Alphaproteobacteria bacterium]|nr:hypothetical protein [Alphaproteobacteria bacterium]